MPPMAREPASEEGQVTRRLVEHSYVTQNGKLSKNQLGIYSDEPTPGPSRLVKSVHEAEPARYD